MFCFYNLVFNAVYKFVNFPKKIPIIYTNIIISVFLDIFVCLFLLIVFFAIFDNSEICSKFILRFWMGYGLKMWKIHFVLKLRWFKNLTSKEKIKKPVNLLPWQHDNSIFKKLPLSHRVLHYYQVCQSITWLVVLSLKNFRAKLTILNSPI